MDIQEFSSQLLLCPSCHGQLSGGQCADCGEHFVSRLGILDLRWPKPSQREIKEEELVRKMLEQFESSTFNDLSELVRRHRFSEFSEELLTNLRHRALKPEQLGQRMMDMFEQRLSKYYAMRDKGIALDLGCGYGTATVSLAQHFDWVVSIDLYLPVLLLARKFLDEHKALNVVLVQAYAQNIPIRDGYVDYAVAQNVIEHLFEVAPAFHEVRRVLREGGCFCGDSRNRYDLFFPEPHVKLRWVGLFPRKLQPWYVHKFKNVSYSDAHAYLLSWRELHRYAHQSFGDSMCIVLPLVSAYGQSSKLDKWIERIDRVPILRKFFLLFFPSHLLLARSI